MQVPFASISGLFFLVFQDKFWGALVLHPTATFHFEEVLGETSHFLSEILGHGAWVNLDWDSPMRLLYDCESSGEVGLLLWTRARCRPTSFLQRGRRLLLIIFILIVAEISLCAGLSM